MEGRIFAQVLRPARDDGGQLLPPNRAAEMMPQLFSQQARASTSVVPACSVPISLIGMSGAGCELQKYRTAREWSLIKERDG